MEGVKYTRYRQYYQRVEPLLKTPRARAYGMAILSFFVLSFFGAFAIRPAVTTIFELNRKISDRHLVNQKLEEKIKNLKLAEKEYQKIQADLPLISAALPKEANFPPFLKTLEQEASATAISLNNLKFQDVSLYDTAREKTSTTSGLPEPQTYYFNLTANGTYSDLISFLNKLERGGRLLGIEDFSLSSEKRGTISAQLNMGLKSRVFFLPGKIAEEPNEQ